MKKSLLALSLLCASAPAFALPTSSRGYIVVNRGMSYYAGLTDDGNDIQLQLSHFSEEQQDTMFACIKKKDQYAVLVESREVLHREPRMPSDAPGRDTVFHDVKITDVSCVRAPGFLAYWRSVFHAGAAN